MIVFLTHYSVSQRNSLHICQLELVLECAHLVDPRSKGKFPAKDRVIEKLIVDYNDMITMTATDADTKYGEAGMSLILHTANALTRTKYICLGQSFIRRPNYGIVFLISGIIKLSTCHKMVLFLDS